MVHDKLSDLSRYHLQWISEDKRRGKERGRKSVMPGKGAIIDDEDYICVCMSWNDVCTEGTRRHVYTGARNISRKRSTVLRQSAKKKRKGKEVWIVTAVVNAENENQQAKTISLP